MSTPLDLSALFGIARTFSSSRYLNGLLSQIISATERLTGSEAASLLLLDEGGQHLYFKAASGQSGENVVRHLVPIDQGVAGWVFRHGESLIINDVSQDKRFTKTIDTSTGFQTRSILAVPLRVGGQTLGVCEAINKLSGPFVEKDQKALEEMADLAAVSIENARRSESESNFFEHTLTILTTAIESTHPRYLGHPSRVAEDSVRVGKVLGIAGNDLENLRLGGLLHDVGLIAANHETLAARSKKGGSTIDKSHPELGTLLLKDIHRFRDVLPLVRHHHERWDGLGFPEGLAGDKIPLGARVIGLLEDLEELRFSSIPDAELKPMMVQRAKNGAGTLFDPAVVAAYLSC